MSRLRNVSLLACLIGLGWRCRYIFDTHPPPNFIYSDMKVYVDSAINFFSPSYRPSIADTLFPPGTAYLLGLLHSLDPSWRLPVIVWFGMAVLVPPLVALTGFELYGKRVGWLALLISSLYYPFLDYFGYFLSEGPLLFFITLGTWLLVRSFKSTARKSCVINALMSGLAFGGAMSVKSLVSLPLLLMGLLILWTLRRDRPRTIPLLSVGFIVGFVLIISPLALRCTRLNEGKFCLISNNGAMNVLLGHYGRIGGIRWQDTQRGFWYEFGCPAAAQRGYRTVRSVPFGAYENGRNGQEAWRWVHDHPLEALHLSVEHVEDLFVGIIPWPSSHTFQRVWANFFQHIYRIFILLPALCLLFRHRRRLKTLEGEGFADLLMIAPMIGLIVVTFLTKGEPRYRIPFDGFMILLAARGYVGVYDRMTRCP